MIHTVNIIEKNERYYEISCVMLGHYMESKLFSITEARTALPSHPAKPNAPQRCTKGSQTDSAPTTLRYVCSGIWWTNFKSIVILSEEHDR